MTWTLLVVALLLAALGLLAVLLVGLWKRVLRLGREVGRAADSLGRATDELAALAPPPGHGSATSATPGGHPAPRRLGPSS